MNMAVNVPETMNMIPVAMERPELPKYFLALMNKVPQRICITPKITIVANSEIQKQEDENK